MADTAKLEIEKLEEGQASAEVTVNDALIRLDTFVQPTVVSKGDTTPPGSPSEGDAYIIASSGATGDWASQDGNFTYYDGSSWIFIAPFEGMIVWVNDENKHLIYDGTNYLDISPTYRNLYYSAD